MLSGPWPHPVRGRCFGVVKNSHTVPLWSFRAQGETGFLWQPKFVAGKECVGSSCATAINYFCRFRVCEIEPQPTFSSGVSPDIIVPGSRSWWWLLCASSPASLAYSAEQDDANWERTMNLLYCCEAFYLLLQAFWQAHLASLQAFCITCFLAEAQETPLFAWLSIGDSLGQQSMNTVWVQLYLCIEKQEQ